MLISTLTTLTVLICLLLGCPIICFIFLFFGYPMLAVLFAILGGEWGWALLFLIIYPML